LEGTAFHSDAISTTDMERYNERCDKIIESELHSIPWAGAVKAFRRVSSAVKIFLKRWEFGSAWN